VSAGDGFRFHSTSETEIHHLFGWLCRIADLMRLPERHDSVATRRIA